VHNAARACIFIVLDGGNLDSSDLVAHGVHDGVPRSRCPPIYY
jgi:hypothetical protein